MKHFESTRIWLTQESTISVLELNGQLQGYVIEPPVRAVFNIPDNTAIPAGTYDLGIRVSPRFNRPVVYLKNVPGFTDGDIEMHPGNFENSVNPATGQVQRDSEACQVVGMVRGLDCLYQSTDLCARLFAVVQAAITANEPVKYQVIDILKPVC